MDSNFARLAISVSYNPEDSSSDSIAVEISGDGTGLTLAYALLARHLADHAGLPVHLFLDYISSNVDSINVPQGDRVVVDIAALREQAEGGGNDA